MSDNENPTRVNLTRVKAITVCTVQNQPSNKSLVLKQMQTQILEKQTLLTQGMFIRAHFPLERLFKREEEVTAASPAWLG